MVFPAVSETETLQSMATQKPLHNFPLPLPGLRWGNQRLFRCMKIDSASQIASSSSPLHNSLPSILQNRDHEIKNRESRQSERERGGVKEIPAADAKEDLELARPWNLRTRRSACNAPRIPTPAEENQLPRMRGANGNQRKRFCISLTREEMEEDFLEITGSKLPKRPKKKRSKGIHQLLDGLFPGSQLSEITADDYRVSDLHDSGKR